MQIKTFKIPLGGGEMEEELNRFLRDHRVLKVERAFCLDGSGLLNTISKYFVGMLIVLSRMLYICGLI